MNNHINIFQGCQAARSGMKRILFIDTYKFQPNLNLTTYNPVGLLISAQVVWEGKSITVEMGEDDPVTFFL